MSAKAYPTNELFDFTKTLSQVSIPGFGYFGRFHLMPKKLGNVYIGLNQIVIKRSEFVLKLLSPPSFIINF
ncbi:MAG: hypothetical protein EBT92_01870 [Planctomycetes bacterium]|nr:hypothetical protein [Planctomycetota bacterium]